MISHAIFASSHPTPHRTASSSTPPPTPRFAPHLALHFAPHLALHFTPHLAQRFTPHPSLHSHPASRLSCTPHPAPHHALHPAPRPPFPSLSLSQVSSSSHRQAPPSKSLHVPQPSPFTPHPIMPFTLRPDPIPHRPFSSHFFAPQDSFSQVPPSTSLHLPPVHPFPIRVSPSSVFLCQAPSPCALTPFHTAHFHRTSLLPRIPLAKSLPPSHSIFLPSANFPSASLHPPCYSAPPVDFLVRKKARLTHGMTFFHHDVRGKRFNTHGASHNMEMSSVKTMWQRSPAGARPWATYTSP